MGVLARKALEALVIFCFKVPKTAVKLVWLCMYFSPNYKSIQIPIEQKLFEKVGENL